MPRMISYAQNAEDVLLDRLFPADHRGFYIDVGANHPTLHSVTRHFYDLGWSGVNVEPVTHVFEMLRAERKRDVSLNVGLSEREGSLTFYEATDSLGMSTFCPDFAGGLRRDGYAVVERTVPVMTLATVCERYTEGRTIDFMKIDVESHEIEVISGGDWRRWRPRAVLIESPDLVAGDWERLLLDADYLFAAYDGLNRYYVRSEDRDLLPRFARPVNVLDDYAPHEYVRPIEDLKAALEWVQADRDAALSLLRAERDDALARLAATGDLGPSSIALARRLRRAAGRFPRVARAVKQAFRTAG